MRKGTIIVLLTAAVIFYLPRGAMAKYSGGTGEPNNPYQIADVNNLLTLGADTNDYSKSFILTVDINLAGQEFSKAIIAADPNLSIGLMGTTFTGTFDGNGHKITNFTIVDESNKYLGLFGYISSPGLVKNLGLENFEVSGSDYIGGLAGFIGGGSISYCYSTGSVSGSSYVGELVGYARYSCHIDDCYSIGSVNGYSHVGGLVGLNSFGSHIDDCYSIGSVNGYSHVGGLVGVNYSSISNCYSTDSVNGSSYVGGLAGNNGPAGHIDDCYATGAVNGSTNVGGLVGVNYSSISNCYSTSAVSGDSNVGGLIGYNKHGNVVSSFWDVNTSEQTTSAGGEGKTTEEMQTLSTYTNADWDFSYTDGNEAVWYMPIDEYPILVWQISPADIYTDGKNNFKDFTVFARYWMRDDCRMYNNFCDFADLNFNGSVDIDDLVEFISYWLREEIYE